MKKQLLLSMLLVGCSGYAVPLVKNEQQELKQQAIDDLVHAAYKGDKKKVNTLLASGVNVNGTDQGGKTALINAALQSQGDLFTVLFEYGADVTLADRQKTSPLIAAVMSFANNQDIAQIEQMVDVLIAKGALVNAQNIGGQTALMLAANLGLKSVVERLLKAGADDQIKNGFGQKAKHLVNENCPCHALLR